MSLQNFWFIRFGLWILILFFFVYVCLFFIKRTIKHRKWPDFYLLLTYLCFGLFSVGLGATLFIFPIFGESPTSYLIITSLWRLSTSSYILFVIPLVTFCYSVYRRDSKIAKIILSLLIFGSGLATGLIWGALQLELTWIQENSIVTFKYLNPEILLPAALTYFPGMSWFIIDTYLHLNREKNKTPKNQNQIRRLILLELGGVVHISLSALIFFLLLSHLIDPPPITLLAWVLPSIVNLLFISLTSLGWVMPKFVKRELHQNFQPG